MYKPRQSCVLSRGTQPSKCLHECTRVHRQLHMASDPSTFYKASLMMMLPHSEE